MRSPAWHSRLVAPLALFFILAPGTRAYAAKYNNTLYGYSVDYPSWWTMDSRTLSDGVRFLMPGSDVIWMQIRVTENPEGQSLDDLLMVLLKTLSGAPEGLATEPGVPKPAAPAGPPGAGAAAGGTVPAETAQPGAAAGTQKSPVAAEEQKRLPSIAVGAPPSALPGTPPPPIDPSKPISGITVRWITLDGTEAWYAELEGQWIVKCLKDGYVYELSANSKFGTMYEWYFGSFFNSFRFQPRLGK